ncbi:MAG TPA: lysoplasmalogenase [Acidimicrobiales bacterium]|nr:lysoplasmalogenase [Acidimicrobiales bacterium]
MTALVVAIAVFAVADWVAVTRGDKRLEYVAKPATTALLVVAALALQPEDSTQRAWFVAALVLSLAGDVFLMLPRDAFVPGLASFLLGHLAYIAGLWREAGDLTPLVAVPLVLAGVLGVRIVRSIDDRKLLGPVVVYMLVITAMACVAATTGDWRAFVGAVVFMASDSMIAWNRFVSPFPYARLAIMSTYHLAQALLVLSLLRR